MKIRLTSLFLLAAGAAFALPPEGLYFGSASYGSENNRTALGPNYTGHAHSRWTGARPTPLEQIRITKEEGYGNCLQFWQSGAYLADLVEAAAKAGVWSFNIYSDADAAAVKRIGAVGDWWLGHDSGEIFHYSEKDCGDKENPTLQDVADGFMRRVRAYVAGRKAAGWGTIMSTGADFSMDYQVAAGITFPCTEDMPFRNLLVSSALERGICRQFGLPLWGSHNAHEWNAFLPVSNPLRMPLLYAGFELKYMTGAKLIVNESGNWEVQSVLCEDSPEHDLPHLAMGAPGIHGVSKEDVAALMPEARRQAHKLGYDSEWCRGYRAEMKRFWDFVKANPAPQGQPRASFAVAKGNLDLCDEKNNPNIPIGGAQRLADRNVNWYPGQPEQSWDVVFDAFCPRPDDVLAPNRNSFLAGTPYGLFDITSFADDRASAAFLLKHYKAVMFAGWNTCTKKQYAVLCDYVKGGGRLVIALPHLSTDVTRNYRNFTREDLVNGGDFTELCGIRVRGRDPTRVWWATAAEPDRSKVNCLGIRWPRRYGIMGMFLGDLELTGPAADYEPLAVDDEAARPIIVRCRKGRGEVFFVNTWCYPAGAETDEGPGERLGSDGLMTTLYKYVASISRGDVYIAAKGGDLPDDDCRYVICSHFPEAGRICLKNIDFRRSHTVDLKAFGRVTTVTLAPAEFRTVVLRGKDKLDAGWWRTKFERNRRLIAAGDGAFDIVMLGDSITHYWEVGEGLDDSHDIEILEKKYRILNCGYGGDRIENLLWRAENGELDGYRAKLVTLMIGTNNHADAPADIVKGVKDVIEVIRRKQPQAKILLMAYLPIGEKKDDGRRKKLEPLNPVLKGLADGKTVFWFDNSRRFLKPDGTTDKEMFDYEYIHPSTKGYRIWREDLEPVLAELI